MGTEDDSLYGHPGRGQSLSRADHATHRAVTFKSRNLHEGVGFTHELSYVLALARAGEMQQLNLRVRRSLNGVHQWAESDRAHIDNRMIHPGIFHAEDTPGESNRVPRSFSRDFPSQDGPDRMAGSRDKSECPASCEPRDSGGCAFISFFAPRSIPVHREEASWTTFPPTTVARGWMSLIRSASQVSRSSESSTRSPSLPTSIEPFLFSSKVTRVRSPTSFFTLEFAPTAPKRPSRTAAASTIEECGLTVTILPFNTTRSAAGSAPCTISPTRKALRAKAQDC